MTIRNFNANARSGLLRALDRAGFPHVGECTGAPGAMRSRDGRGVAQRYDGGRDSARGEAMR